METLRLPFWAVCPSFRQGTLNNCNPKQGGGLDIWDPLMKRRLLFGGGYHDSNLFPTNPNHQSKPWEMVIPTCIKGYQCRVLNHCFPDPNSLLGPLSNSWCPIVNTSTIRTLIFPKKREHKHIVDEFQKSTTQNIFLQDSFGFVLSG